MKIETIKPNQENIEQEKLRSKIEVVHDAEGKVTNVIISEGDKKLDLYEFLPRDNVFVTSTEFEFRAGERSQYTWRTPSSVIFPEEEVNSLSGRLGLLHEMGHAISLSAYFGTPYYPEARHDIDLIIRVIRQSAEFEKLKNREDQEDYIIQEFQRYRKSSPILKSDEDVIRTIKGIAYTERMAWAEALKLYRKIKSERDLDLLRGAESEEIFKIMEGDLASYQDLYGILIPEQQIKLFLIKKFSG